MADKRDRPESKCNQPEYANNGRRDGPNHEGTRTSRRSHSRRRRRQASLRRRWKKLGRVPKLMGADVELGNFLSGVNRSRTGEAASRLLIRHVEGVSRSTVYHAMDSHRKYLPGNGGSAYIDLDHAEFPLPEVLSARQFLTAWHATLRIARQAMIDANEHLPPGQRLCVLVNNSDGQGHSYGSHCNFLITRRTFDNMFHRKLHHLLYLASFQVSSIIFTGQGKVGSEDGSKAVDYQISQRADFLETLQGIQTTYHRPIVNSRDEALCGETGRSREERSELARLHVIFFDATLCHVATYLRMGTMQLILAMVESEFIDPQLLLDDPVASVRRWSRDPDLASSELLANGRRVTAVDHQRYYLDCARSFDECGGFDGVVPEATQILSLWEETLDQLAHRDFDRLAGSLDWVLKRSLLEQTMAARPELNWQSPQLKHLDHLYSSLDSDQGLYWAMERSGLVRQLATPGQIERYVYEPPEDTRAWTRAMLLRTAGNSHIDQIDWDRITFRLPGIYGFSRYPTLWMPNPLALTREQTEHLFTGDLELDEIVAQLQDMVAEGSTEGRIAVVADAGPS